MKQFASLVIAVALALTVAACGGKKASTTPAADTTPMMGGETYGGAAYGGDPYGNPCGMPANPCGG